MLTVKQVAVRACVGESLVRRWVRDGTLPHLRVGARGSRGKILVLDNDLDELLARFKVGASVPRPKPVRSTPLKHLRPPS
ncbi:MAG: helix-turn-helix domain-containing protein [Fimbriiglobus sp.]